MCKRVSYGDTRIVPCMRGLIKFLNSDKNPLNITVLACCCGHGKYPMSIVVRNNDVYQSIYELMSNTLIPRLKRFYKSDKKGRYYLPEVIGEKK